MNPKRARIQLAGASGTGKTTIAMKLARDFGLPYRGSVNRKIQEKFGVTHKTQTEMSPNALWTMQQVLSAAQLENLNAPGAYVSDRSVLDGFVYALQVSGGLMDAVWMNDQIQEICSSLAGIDLLVIVPWPAPFDVPDDGFRRTIPGEQLAFHLMLNGLVHQLELGSGGITLPRFGHYYVGTKQFDLDDRVKGIVGAVVEGDIAK